MTTSKPIGDGTHNTAAAAEQLAALRRSSLAQRPTVAVAHSFYRRRGKRLLDLALGIPLCLLLLPVTVLAGLAIFVTSGWPILYGSERRGQDGRRFRMWKFRTMVRDANEVLRRWEETRPDLAEEYSENFKLKVDPRLTLLGRFFRRSSLDELPQLWNVLCGQMTLVGPRPYNPKLAAHSAFEEVILSVPPGMTGPWQVQGRNTLPPPTRMGLDVKYVSEVRFTKDLKYLLRTIKTVTDLDGV